MTEMSKAKKNRAVEAMSMSAAKQALREIVVDCIHEGRRLQMTSSEILDEICGVLREAGLDDPHPEAAEEPR